MLLLALKHLGQATPAGIKKYFGEVSDEDKQRPIADVLIDKLLASNQRGVRELPELISKTLAASLSPFETSERSDEQTQIGRFLIEWRQVESLLRRISGSRGIGAHSALNMINSLETLTLRDSIHEIRKIRNSLIHGIEAPPAFVLDDATNFLHMRIVPELKKLAHHL